MQKSGGCRPERRRARVCRLSREGAVQHRGDPMRERINEAVKDAMRSKDKLRLSTLRLMAAALKDQDIAKRTEDGAQVLGAQEVTALFAKMVKQREDSIKAYEEAGRMEMAEQERAEQAVIREFLPKQLSEEEVDAAIKQAVIDTGAESLRDMGKVMGILKADHAGKMDFGVAGGKLKAILG